ncbi:hypothetical protein IAD21_03103 [Abditibacteriota bacterium]|nr:hypothetical protein IAD21_03103 [Abditibacteriota bacterium]
MLSNSGALLVGALMISSCAMAAPTRTVALSSLDISLAEQGWGQPKQNLSVGGNPLSVGGKKFTSGWGTHARSILYIQLNGARRFTAQVGADDEEQGKGTVIFSLENEGKTLWTSGLCKGGEAPRSVDIDVSKVTFLTLRVTDGGDNADNDHADWLDAQFQTDAKTDPVTVDSLPSQKGQILPGKIWRDTSSRPIQAHGGGILKVGDIYYWYGEEKSQGYNNKVGVACYSSRDLTNWKFEAIVLPKAGFPEEFRDSGVCERPKVVYNARTKKYVMWSHLDARGYAVSKPGVAISDSPTGPFTFLNDKSVRPVADSTYRDMNLWVDDDGKAYAFYSGEGNATMHVIRLDDDYTAPEMPMVEGKTWARMLVSRQREAPAPFKWRGKYYIITSACTGWAANAASYAVADSPLGPWKEFDNPCIGEGAKTTFTSQSTYVLPLGGDRFMYMGDRWKPDNLADSRYIWLPFTIKPDGTFTLEWTDGWKPTDK